MRRLIDPVVPAANSRQRAGGGAASTSARVRARGVRLSISRLLPNRLELRGTSGEAFVVNICACYVNRSRDRALRRQIATVCNRDDRMRDGFWPLHADPERISIESMNADER